MDRAILEGDPHSVIEAMIIGGYAIVLPKDTFTVGQNIRLRWSALIMQLNKHMNMNY